MQRRFGSDRRKYPRGGRRPEDQPGRSPLVMVIEPDAGRRDVTEAILAKLRFAVVPVDSIDQAAAIGAALRPTVIVCPPQTVTRCAAALPTIPIVGLVESPDALVERIREAIRAAKIVPFTT
jgi:hypothetical protein